MVKRILLGMLGGSLILFFCVVAESRAQVAEHLVISEVQVGGNTAEDEFIELYNPTSVAVDISAWSIQYKSATGTTFQKKNFESQASVPARGFFLIARSAYDGIAVADMTQGTFSLAASGGNIFLVSDQILLTSTSDAAIVDKIGYGTGDSPENIAALVPPANQSIERQAGGVDTDDNANDFFIQTSPNPQNSGDADSVPDDPEIEFPDIQAGEIVINEFVPNPTDGAEWIELYNNTDKALSLEGCKIYDGTESAILSLSNNVAAQGFFVIELSSAKLNNTGDIVILKNANNAIVDQVVYGNWNDGNTADNAPNPSDGQAVARKSNGVDTNRDNIDFAVSDQTTPWLANIIHATTTKIQGSANVGANFGTAVPLPKIVINEFAVGKETEPSWVELYIGGEVSMDLDGWYLENGDEDKTNLYGVLIPGQFKVIEKINGGFNSNGDILRLKNKNGEVYDRVSYGVWEDGKTSDNAPVASAPFSIARIKDGGDTNNDKKDFAITSLATKGKANVIIKNIPSPLPSPAKAGEGVLNVSPLPAGEGQGEGNADVAGKLFINEILPNPEGSDNAEWVELFWEGDVPLDLSGFSIDDEEGGSKPFIIGSSASVGEAELPIIKYGEYMILKREMTKLAFNNDTDSARLFDKNGKIINEVEYEEGEEGMAYARGENGAWSWTSQPTAGLFNIIKEPSPSPLPKGEGGLPQAGEGYKYVELARIRGLELGDNVKVKGVVAVLPGVLGSQIFYIEESNQSSDQVTTKSDLVTSGIQIYSNKKDFPKLNLGDLVQITGALSQAQGEFRIKTKTADDILVISKGADPTAREFDGEELSENEEGSLIKIQGTIIDKTSAGFVMSASFGEVFIVIKKTAGINVSEIIPGSRVIITGIVGNSTSGYRIMPRFQQDIEVIGMDELAVDISSAENSSKENTPYGKATAYAGGGAALAAFGIRRRKLFVNGVRAVLFVMGKGNGNGKGVI